MVKVSALYGHPSDPAAFERYYHSVHMPLAVKLPNMLRYETALFLPKADGSKPAYYRMFEAWYETADKVQASMALPEGQATVADVPNLASGGLTMRMSPTSRRVGSRSWFPRSTRAAPVSPATAA